MKVRNFLTAGAALFAIIVSKIHPALDTPHLPESPRENEPLVSAQAISAGLLTLYVRAYSRTHVSDAAFAEHNA
jgi:hypothetical protein